MPLTLNEEQRLLRDTAREFLDGNAPVAALRKLRDEKDPMGYIPDLWRQMADMGWASIILPEEFGGLEFGFLGLGGRQLPAPRIAVTVEPPQPDIGVVVEVEAQQQSIDPLGELQRITRVRPVKPHQGSKNRGRPEIYFLEADP